MTVLRVVQPHVHLALEYARPGHPSVSGLPALVCLWVGGHSVPSAW
ncbi:hypothetical protein AB0O91_05705 [Kitasatospora sp. NPDC089797]